MSHVAITHFVIACLWLAAVFVWVLVLCFCPRSSSFLLKQAPTPIVSLWLVAPCVVFVQGVRFVFFSLHANKIAYKGVRVLNFNFFLVLCVCVRVCVCVTNKQARHRHRLFFAQ